MQALTILSTLFVFLASGLALAEQEPRYSCPEMDVGFAGYDIDDIHNVRSWQDCGMYVVLLYNTLFIYSLLAPTQKKLFKHAR